jgi:hypothetical protein
MPTFLFYVIAIAWIALVSIAVRKVERRSFAAAFAVSFAGALGPAFFMTDLASQAGRAALLAVTAVLIQHGKLVQRGER